MRIFVAGATGAIGRALIPALVSAGHSVTGMTRSPEKAAAIRQANPAILQHPDRIPPGSVLVIPELPSP